MFSCSDQCPLPRSPTERIKPLIISIGTAQINHGFEIVSHEPRSALRRRLPTAIIHRLGESATSHTTCRFGIAVPLGAFAARSRGSTRSRDALRNASNR